MKIRLSINGRFLSSTPTGVQRVAEEIVMAIDHELHRNFQIKNLFDIRLLVPKNANRNLNLKHIRVTKVGLFTGIAWEQFELQYAARGSILVNFCNLGPLLHSNSITMIHDTQVYSQPKSYRLLFRLWYKFAQPIIGRHHLKILTVSHYSKQNIVNVGICSDNKITVVFNGVDHMQRIGLDDSVRKQYTLTRSRYVVALASTQTHKNIGILIEAFRSKSLSDLNLVLFGNSSKRQISNAFGDLPSNCIITGRISDAQLRSLMENALCLAFPSVTEGFGLPPLEAMSIGCPVVISPSGALLEICGDAANHATHDDCESWICAIKQFQDDEEHRNRAIAKGYMRAKYFRWSRAALKVLDLVRFSYA